MHVLYANISIQVNYFIIEINGQMMHVNPLPKQLAFS